MANEEHVGIVKQGAKAIAEWRRANPGEMLDLREANLTGANLSEANLSSADLSSADLSEAKLLFANLSKANLFAADLSKATPFAADLSEANLSKANLSEADLTGANLSEARLSEANLSEANLSGASLKKADLTGANLSEARLSEANISGANLREANLSKANLTGANLSEANLSRADLSKADLTRADLSEADFGYAILSGAKLSEANLSGANLSEASLGSADLGGAFLFNADLSEANLSGAFLFNADLSEANLSKADLSEADFGYAILSGAKLSEANLSGAKLKKANLSGASLKKANLSGADLSDAHLKADTLLTGAIVTSAKVDRHALESLKEYGGLTKGDRMTMEVRDGVATLRNSYSGFWLWFHLFALALFISPYASFLGMQWVKIELAPQIRKLSAKARSQAQEEILALRRQVTVLQRPIAVTGASGAPRATGTGSNQEAQDASKGDQKGEEGRETATVLTAFGRYIWSGGDVVKNWSFRLMPFLAFLFLLLYNGLRAVLLWKTKSLELQQEASGLPVIFSLAGGWGRTYIIAKWAFFANVAVLLYHTGHFMMERVTV